MENLELPPRFVWSRNGKEYVVPRQPGYVYLLFCPGCNLYKFGSAEVPATRRSSSLKTLHYPHCNGHQGAKLIHQVRSTDKRMAEYAIHELFESSRVIGEWFRLIEADINWFLSMSVVDAPFCNVKTQQFVPDRLKWGHQYYR
jgi:hypothetical protein